MAKHWEKSQKGNQRSNDSLALVTLARRLLFCPTRARSASTSSKSVYGE